jgi:hypothetical protein
VKRFCHRKTNTTSKENLETSLLEAERMTVAKDLGWKGIGEMLAISIMKNKFKKSVV